MINEPKMKKGVNDFAEEIKEVSIRKHFESPKTFLQNMNTENILYCDPPEVILQSKFITKIKNINIYNYRCRKK